MALCSYTASVTVTTLERCRSLYSTGDYLDAADLLDECIPQVDDPGERSALLLERAHVALILGSLREGELLLRELEGLGEDASSQWAALSGATAMLRGDHPRAQDLLWRALHAVQGTGAVEVELRLWHNLAAAALDQGQDRMARGLLTYAGALQGSTEQRVTGLGLLGAVYLQAGELDPAESLLAMAVEQAETRGLTWAASGARGARGAVLARLGRLDEAAQELQTARARLPAQYRWGHAQLDLWEGYLDLALGRHAAARERLQAANRPVVDDLGPLDADFLSRLAARGLCRLLGEAEPVRPPPSRPSLEIGPEGTWIRVGAGALVVVSAAAGRRLLVALGQHATARPGAPLSAQELVAAGWPGERILREAGRNRLYVELNKLRKVGLGAVLVTRREGYLLDAAAVRWAS